MIHTKDSDFTLHVGDVTDVLATLPDQSVHCVVTSPPYWGLRDYGTGQWDGGNPDCDHEGDERWYTESTAATGSADAFSKPGEANKARLKAGRWREKGACVKCGAVHSDPQLGLEATPDLYVARMVAVFREVRRVLRDDGTCWVNLGDSYASTAPGTVVDPAAMTGKHVHEGAYRRAQTPAGLKPKDLVGIPWRVAFALQADGWYLRADIIWAKPNPMPESVTDRPTKAHEFVFLLTKAPWKGRVPGPIESRMSTEDARWLALLVDAEGNICVKRVAPKDGQSPQYAAQIAVGSTSRALLERARDIVGAGNINERAGTNAPMWYWQVSNKVAQDLLYALYPHLIVKPRQARIAIHLEDLLYHRGRPNGRTDSENVALASLWERNKACNQFGEPDLSDVPAPKYGRWGPSRYFFDQEAVREPSDYPELAGKPQRVNYANGSKLGRSEVDPHVVTRTAGRNVRSVWEIATQPYPMAHFATFPEELARRCILAGTSERGVCPECGAPWVREVEREHIERGEARHPTGRADKPYGTVPGSNTRGVPFRQVLATGWRPTCACFDFEEQDGTRNPYPPVPATVLDPFLGSGTVAHVARKHGRRSVGVELNPAYADLAAQRLSQLSLLA